VPVTHYFFSSPPNIFAPKFFAIRFFIALRGDQAFSVLQFFARILVLSAFLILIIFTTNSFILSLGAYHPHRY